jgi:hypothetical protein
MDIGIISEIIGGYATGSLSVMTLLRTLTGQGVNFALHRYKISIRYQQDYLRKFPF